MIATNFSTIFLAMEKRFQTTQAQINNMKQEYLEMEQTYQSMAVQLEELQKRLQSNEHKIEELFRLTDISHR